jgi:uncharacterized membrane protein
MKEIIWKSILAICLIALILTVGTYLPQMVRGILALLAVIFVFSYAFYNRAKPIKVK